jgi:hypothetical protein
MINDVIKVIRRFIRVIRRFMAVHTLRYIINWVTCAGFHILINRMGRKTAQK